MQGVCCGLWDKDGFGGDWPGGVSSGLGGGRTAGGDELATGSQDVMQQGWLDFVRL